MSKKPVEKAPKIHPNTKRNIESIKKRNLKYRNYALFQFFSTTAVFLISLALGLAVYIGVHYHRNLEPAFFEEIFRKIITFNGEISLNIFIGIVTYFAFFLWFVAMIFALVQIKNKNRSLFDAAFLLFFFIPVLSNIITLFCQISERIYKTPTEFVDEYKTKIEYIQSLDAYVAKESKKQRKNVNHAD